MTAPAKYVSADTRVATTAYEKARDEWEDGKVPTRTLTAARDRLQRSRDQDAEMERVVLQALEGKPSTHEGAISVCEAIEGR
jgi:hypothetical protein